MADRRWRANGPEKCRHHRLRVGGLADERSMYVFRKTEATPKVYLVNLSTGRNEPWREITPADRVGVVNVWGVRAAPDDRSYYYSYTRNLSDLYLLDGLR